MPKPERKLKTNLRRCPLLKITYEEVEADGKSTKVIEEFQECYQSFCMAWHGTGCSYFEPRQDQPQKPSDEGDE